MRECCPECHGIGYHWKGCPNDPSDYEDAYAEEQEEETDDD